MTANPPPTQPALPGFPLACGFIDCEQEAVCGLYHKDDPETVINVCHQHFKKLRHRSYRKGKEATP